MDKETAWSIYFAGVLSLRFHPKNEHAKPSEEIANAAYIADRAIIEHERRFPWHGEQSQQQQSAPSAAESDNPKPTARTCHSTEKIEPSKK